MKKPVGKAMPLLSVTAAFPPREVFSTVETVPHGGESTKPGGGGGDSHFYGVPLSFEFDGLVVL